MPRPTLRNLAVLLLLLAVAGCAAREAPPPQPTPTESMRETIATDAAPAAIGPYSQAVRVGNTVYCAGQIGFDPATGEVVAGGIEAETRQALTNLQHVLDAAGFTLADAVQVQVFLADLGDYQAMNTVYAEFFPDAAPARAAFQVARLPRDARVEIMLTAAK